MQSLLNTRMSFLKAKSEFNKSAADLLYQNSYYAPSIHCAYYSCFQLAKFIIKTKLNIDYAEQAKEIEVTRAKTHTYVRDKIFNKISTIEKDPLVLRTISNKWKDLQTFRKKSDYDNILIDEPISKKAIDNSNELNHYLREKLL